ncbi:3'-5' exonuclease [Thauera sinica]|uniref:PolC-type DNA polymerase III n=1 Tax=Thauera sinica TaxID=2665146 RepID=A0ABW1ARK1_9RHOO|nr:3'-5' exonuclease [Thauera sp. K11]ATE59723.1 DNA polymerase III subunit epsilon [Thauera sp. K11]
MNWISRFIGGRGESEALDRGVAETLAHWQSLVDADLSRAHFETRYAVLNTEATGLDLDRDRLLAVGAIAIEGGLISPAGSYYSTLEPSPSLALCGLLEFVRKDPVVVFNAAFNLGMLEPVLDQRLGIALDAQTIDLYFLLPALFPERHGNPVRLGDWMESFGIGTFQRHHALGDGWAVAQLFLAAQARALAQGAASPRALQDLERAYRQYRRKA